MKYFPMGKHKDATHVLHKYVKVAMDLKTIGVPSLTPDFIIVDNDDERNALISHCKRMKTTIFPDMPSATHPYCTELDNRVTQFYGSDEWTTLFGESMQEARREAVEKLQEARQTIKDEEADGLTPGVKPNVSRKRVR